MLSRLLASALIFTMAFAPAASMAGPKRLFCRVALSGPEAEIDRDRIEVRDEVAAKTLELNDKLQAHWDKQQQEIMETAQFTNSVYSSLTARFVRLSKHTYPFADLQSGIPQRVRLWVKGNGKDQTALDTEIRGWFDRYRDYLKNRRETIERMAAVQVELKLLKGAKDLDKFPIDIQVPTILENGQIRFESRHYTSVKAVAQDLTALHESESAADDTIWLRHFAHRRSLEARDREQAALYRRLLMTRDELTKLNDGLGDAELRANTLKEIDELLANNDLLPPPYAVYLETRGTFFRELKYWLGVNQKYDEKGSAANMELAENRDFNLGINQGEVGIMRKSLRMILISIPVQLPAIALAWAIPAANHEFNIYVQPSYFIKTIVNQPDETYLKNARDFLRDRYSIRIDKNHISISAQDLKAIRKLQTMHQKYKEDEAKRADETAALNRMLSQPRKILDPKIFADLLQTATVDEAQRILTQNQATPIEIKNILLLRSEYRAHMADKEKSGDVVAELYDDFLLEPAK